MYAMLGGVRFEPLTGFTSLEAEHSATFAKHDVLQGRPRLQAVGNELSTLRFSLKLHWLLGNPDAAYQGLLAAKESQQAQALVYGSGRFAGWFVIERLTERTLVQDGKGRTAARELDVELTEFAGDPNNPLPTPGVMSGGKNPLLALLPESVQAQASDIMQAVRKGVEVYREAESRLAELQRVAAAAKDLKNDPAALFGLMGDALGSGSEILAKLDGLPQVTEIFGRLDGAAVFAAQAAQAASDLGVAVAGMRAGVENDSFTGRLDGIATGVESAASSLADGAAAVETLTAYLAYRRDI
ncbi:MULTISPECIES: phage tail protein [unclassified Neisseria]|uniref:phage tail protein n=1 Tax=unclassified Neisseria TaxID=2623750 RepID=UPI0010729B2F|nr:MULTISPECIES: phage tail protein [unclassified Neisseria]MBF0802899.1 phage tail protein [Neisseria sp. 19428wB4_WF04]TFU44434.1 phage tail protein [Neisseria sp. WF04]